MYTVLIRAAHIYYYPVLNLQILSCLVYKYLATVARNFLVVPFFVQVVDQAVILVVRPDATEVSACTAAAVSSVVGAEPVVSTFRLRVEESAEARYA